MNLEQMTSKTDLDDPFSFCYVDRVLNQALTSSTNVASYFEKQHFHVLRDIEDLIEAVKAVDPGFVEKNFIKDNYRDAYGRFQPEYKLTKDGFTLLAMGYTGTKAVAFKIAYINAFNAMQKALVEDNNNIIARLSFIMEHKLDKEMEKTRKCIEEAVRKEAKRLR